MPSIRGEGPASECRKSRIGNSDFHAGRSGRGGVLSALQEGQALGLGKLLADLRGIWPAAGALDSRAGDFPERCAGPQGRARR